MRLRGKDPGERGGEEQEKSRRRGTKRETKEEKEEDQVKLAARTRRDKGGREERGGEKSMRN